MDLKLSEIKKLRSEDLPDLVTEAKKGNPSAVENLVRYSIWRKISRFKIFKEKTKDQVYEFMISLVSIQVKN